MRKSYNNCFYGIHGIKLLTFGANGSDPVIIWRGYYFNYYDVEQSLWETFKEYIPQGDGDFLRVQVAYTVCCTLKTKQSDITTYAVFLSCLFSAHAVGRRSRAKNKGHLYTFAVWLAYRRF